MILFVVVVKQKKKTMKIDLLFPLFMDVIKRKTTIVQLTQLLQLET